jgi:hypothetical protein
MTGRWRGGGNRSTGKQRREHGGTTQLPARLKFWEGAGIALEVA